jgi:hypothetical protein
MAGEGRDEESSEQAVATRDDHGRGIPWGLRSNGAPVS